MNKKVFTVKNCGNEIELAVKKPTADIRIKSQLVYNKAWKEGEASGSTLRRNLEDLAEKHGVWDDEKRRRVEVIADEVRLLERKLRGGANNFDSKESAKECAFLIRKLRREFLELNRAKDELYQYTAESYADRARTNYMVSQCCVDNTTGKPFWRNYDEFVEQSDTEVGKVALEKYFELTFEDMEDVESQLYENQWLLKYGYMDEKFRPINSEGKLIDPETNKLIDSDGYYVLEDGVSRCDKDGNAIDKDGNYLVTYKEFD